MISRLNSFRQQAFILTIINPGSADRGWPGQGSSVSAYQAAEISQTAVESGQLHVYFF